MRKTWKVWVFAGMMFVFLFLLSAVSSAEESSMPVLKTQAKTLAVFKNGLGFFSREGRTAVDKNGWAVTESVPDATLGTFWLRADGLEELIALKEEQEKEEEINVSSMEELLEANAGKEATITLDERTLSGKIRILSDNKPVSFIIMETEEGEVALRTGQIKEIRFSQSSSGKVARKKKETVKRLKFKLGKAKQGKTETATLSYLQKGIGWTPSYLVDIKDGKKAKIAMKALLINDVEDLENIDISFVVGYPNFVYADILSPMNLVESLSQFLNSLERGGTRGIRGGIASNIMAQRATFAEASSIGGDIFDFSVSTKTPGASEEDLFLYQKKGLNLNKGERASYYIFSGEVDYSHIYQFDVPDTLNVDRFGNSQQRQREGEIGPQVWHSLKLLNSTIYPWTTAPAFIVSGDKPLAQDTINYTPKGVETNLKITVATDVKVDYSEYEEARQRDVKIRYNNYDLVTVKGEIYLKNCKGEDINLEVKKAITGEVLEAGYEGKIKKVAEGITGVNSSSLISWEIPLKTGKEITLPYSYKVYIR
ncbi:MAG: hypothetical protein JW957_04600 [Candidatus Omnitrophica bacterium]|nr:hypothetical protein [Candidatus Omnitrophota bacterium]